MKVKGNHPLAEIICKCLTGIELDYISKAEKQRMVLRACRKAIEWHEDNR